MSLRIRFVFTLLLLLLALFCVIFAAKATADTWQQFRQQNTLTKSGDVRTVRTWMTIPYIAHTYHVPETYLCSQLEIANSLSVHHMTLNSLATRYNRPIDHLVHDVQGAIINYRKEHHNPIKPAPAGPKQVPTGKGKP